MANCTVDEDLVPWVVAAVVNLGVDSLLGAIGNSCCVWCLLQCKITKPAIRFQLLCVFSLMLACSVITLPIVTFMYYNNTFCRSFISPEVKFWFSAINSIVLQMERASFATVAVFRMIAVCWPQMYTKWSKMNVVVKLQAGLIVYTVPMWLVYGALTGFKLLPGGGSVMHMSDHRFGSSILYLNITVYVLYYTVPFLVTLIASIIMIICLRQQEQILGSVGDSSVDHVVRSTSLVILVNLLIDCPHVIIHMIPDDGVPSVLIHMIFFHHLMFDPIIFIFSNPTYRWAVLRLLQQRLPKVCRRVLPQPPNPLVIHGDSLEMQPTHKSTSVAE